MKGIYNKHNKKKKKKMSLYGTIFLYGVSILKMQNAEDMVKEYINEE